MLGKFDEMGSTLITFSEEDQQKIREIGIPFLDEIADMSELNKKGVEIIKNHLRIKGYMK